MNKRYSKVEIADTFLKRTLGLMFRKPGMYHMIFTVSKPQRVLIHTLFMRFPIDVTFYNEEGVIVKTVKHMKPWRVAYCKYKVSKVVERTSVLKQ
jgi:uncharacterized membrane protein (UPF0127 family)